MNKCPVITLVDHRGDLFLILRNLYSVLAVPFHILTNGAQVSQFAHTSGLQELEEGENENFLSHGKSSSHVRWKVSRVHV